MPAGPISGRMSLHLHQDHWERWLQTLFAIALAIGILWIEVAIFYAFSDLYVMRASIHRAAFSDLRFVRASIHRPWL
jgi:hypothetical protein